MVKMQANIPSPLNSMDTHFAVSNAKSYSDLESASTVQPHLVVSQSAHSITNLLSKKTKNDTVPPFEPLAGHKHRPDLGDFIEDSDFEFVVVASSMGDIPINTDPVFEKTFQPKENENNETDIPRIVLSTSTELICEEEINTKTIMVISTQMAPLCDAKLIEK